jgi:hypothetical protein
MWKTNRIITKLLDVVTDMSPETRNILLDALERAVDVAAKADAVADAAAANKAADDAADDAARRAEYATADAVINRYKQNGSKPPFDDDKHGYYDLWKHTPLPKRPEEGGSRKRSTNCRRPRGFSQRQHCKYGRRGRAAATRRRIKSKSKYARD